MGLLADSNDSKLMRVRIENGDSNLEKYVGYLETTLHSLRECVINKTEL